MSNPQTPIQNKSARARLTAPLKISVAWLAGTYLLFLTIGQVGEVDNLLQLTLFVASTIVMFAAGYLLKLRTLRSRMNEPPPAETAEEFTSVRRYTFWSGVYFGAYGLALLAEYGATGPNDVVGAILHPGTAYQSKFDVYATQQAIGESNPIIQVLTLASVMYAPLVPFLVLYWGRLSLTVRVVGLLGVVLYGSYFLYIGTLKGLGDLLIFLVTALMVLYRGNWGWRRRKNLAARKLLIPLAVLGVAFGSYMAFNQADRLTTFGIQDQFEPSPIISALTSDQFARGVAVVGFYPTHGYLGLSKNLGTPFVWTFGRGSSRAFDSYLTQYLGGDGVQDETYPARTESRTGWPAGQLWATIYPWLASDLTFPGAALFMGLVGWWTARFWFEAAFQRNRLALLLLCQLALLMAYVPANNQIGVSRTSLIGFITLALLYWFVSVKSETRMALQAKK